MPMPSARFRSAADRLLSFMDDRDFAGADPFDGLNSTLFQATPLNRFALARLAWIQVHKRSPFNFRKAAGVPDARNPKGIALVILGLLLDHSSTGKAALLDR